MAQCLLVLKFNNLRAKGHCAKVYIGAKVLKGGNMKDVKNLTVQEAIFLETVRGNKEVASELIDAYTCGNVYMERALKSAICDGDITFVSGVLFCEPPTSYCYMSFYEAEQKENFYGTSLHRRFALDYWKRLELTPKENCLLLAVRGQYEDVIDAAELVGMSRYAKWLFDRYVSWKVEDGRRLAIQTIVDEMWP